jgi:hypothetical protein
MCHAELADDHADKLAREAINLRLPSVQRLYLAYVVKPKSRTISDGMVRDAFNGNCYAVACTLQKWLLGQYPELEVRRVHGLWHGDDVRSNRGIQQHGWLVVKVPIRSEYSAPPIIVDPTQFIFTGGKPGITMEDADDSRYDEAGTTLRSKLMPPAIPKRAGKATVKLKLTRELRAWLADLFGDKRDLSAITMDEAFYLGNLSVSALGSHAKALHAALKAVKLGALIPIEIRERVEGVTSKPYRP